MALYDDYLSQNKSLLDYYAGLRGTSTGLSPETTAGLTTQALETVPANFDRAESDLFTTLRRQNPTGLPMGGEYLRAFAPLEAAKESTRAGLLRDVMMANEAEKRRTLDLNNQYALTAAGQLGNVGTSLYANAPGNFKSLLLSALLSSALGSKAGKELINTGVGALGDVLGIGGPAATTAASTIGPSATALTSQMDQIPIAGSTATDAASALPLASQLATAAGIGGIGFNVASILGSSRKPINSLDPNDPLNQYFSNAIDRIMAAKGISKEQAWAIVKPMTWAQLDAYLKAGMPDNPTALGLSGIPLQQMIARARARG